MQSYPIKKEKQKVKILQRVVMLFTKESPNVKTCFGLLSEKAFLGSSLPSECSRLEPLLLVAAAR